MNTIQKMELETSRDWNKELQRALVIACVHLIENAPSVDDAVNRLVIRAGRI